MKIFPSDYLESWKVKVSWSCCTMIFQLQYHIFALGDDFVPYLCFMKDMNMKYPYEGYFQYTLSCQRHLRTVRNFLIYSNI